MPRIAVPVELAGASAKLHSDASTFGEILAKLRAQVAELEFTWKGSPGSDGAHSNFVLYTNEWDNASQALFTTPKGEGLLDAIAHMLAIVNRNYVDVELTNARGWRH